MEFTEEEKEAIRYIMDESHTDFVFRTNVLDYFAEILREPLFKTHDGIDIYEGDAYWYINDNNDAVQVFTATGRACGSLQFSCKETARAYVYTTVPVYTELNILAAVNAYSMSAVTIEEIKNLLQRK